MRIGSYQPLAIGKGVHREWNLEEAAMSGAKGAVVRGIEKGITSKIGSELARLGVDVVDAVGRSTVMTAINPHTYRDTLNNMTGQVTYGYDENGKAYYLVFLRKPTYFLFF
jgi:hypothetical protein